MFREPPGSLRTVEDNPAPSVYACAFWAASESNNWLGNCNSNNRQAQSFTRCYMRVKEMPAVILSVALLGRGLSAADTAKERLTASAEVFSEIMGTPDKGIPQDLLEKAQCVIIVPGLKKAAFVVGGEFGKGFVECRSSGGTGWGAPAAVRVEGGSVGFQIGGSSTDVVM